MIFLGIIQAALMLALEIPLGIISDKIGHRKGVLIFGKAVKIITYIIFIYAIVVVSISNYLWDYYQLYLMHIDLDVGFWGIVTVVLAVLTAFTKLLAYKIPKQYSITRILNILLVVSTLCIATVGILNNILGIAFLGIALMMILMLYATYKIIRNNKVEKYELVE